MNATEALREVWPHKVMRFGSLSVRRIDPQRHRVLCSRRNRWACDNPKRQTGISALGEWLFVLSRSSAELAELAPLEPDDWDATVDEFIGSTPDSVLTAFGLFLSGTSAAYVEERDHL